MSQFHNMYAFVNEKTINEVIYTAYRNTENPKDVKVVIQDGDNIKEIKPVSLKEYWSNLK